MPGRTSSSAGRERQTSYYEAVPDNDYAGPITVDSVTLRTYSGEDTLMLAMMNGEIDAMFNYANPIDATIIEIVDDPEHRPRREHLLGPLPADLRHGTSTGQRPCVPRGGARRLDYEQLAITINGDYGLAPGPASSRRTTGATTPACRSWRDLDAAAARLDEAGYLDADGDGWRDFPDGSPMEVLVPAVLGGLAELAEPDRRRDHGELRRRERQDRVDEASLANSEIWEANVTDGAYDLSIGYTTSGVALHHRAWLLPGRRQGG